MENFAQTPIWIGWLLLSILLLIIEIFIPSFVLIWFAIGAAAALVASLFPGLDLGFQIAIFGVASVAGLFGLRPFLKARNSDAEDNRELNNFSVNVVGAPGVLTEAITSGQGRARVGDSTWTVTGPDLPVKTRIRVVSVEGVTLNVKADDPY
ncbi:MAG: NfeD family protein [Alphaproteobacteria bacterium]